MLDKLQDESFSYFFLNLYVSVTKRLMVRGRNYEVLALNPKILKKLNGAFIFHKSFSP